MNLSVAVLCCALVLGLSGCGSPPKIQMNPLYKGTALPTLSNFKQSLNELDHQATPKLHYRFADGGFPQKDDKSADLVANNEHWLKNASFAYWLNENEVLLQVNPTYFMLINLQDGSQTLWQKQQLLGRADAAALLNPHFRVLESLTDYNETADVCHDFYEDKTIELLTRNGNKSVVIRQHQTYKGSDKYRMVKDLFGSSSHEERYCSTTGWLIRHCYISEVIERNDPDEIIYYDDLDLNEVPCPGKGSAFLMDGNDYKLENGYLSDDAQFIVGENARFDLLNHLEIGRENGWVAKMKWSGGTGMGKALFLHLALPNTDNTRAFMVFSILNSSDNKYYYGTFDLKP